MTDDERRRAAWAVAKERSALMLDDDLREATVAAETVRRSVHHRDDGFASDWHASMPREPEAAPAAPARRKLTDAVSARLMAEIDRRITAAVASAMAELWPEIAKGTAMSITRTVTELREEIAAEVGSLRADLTIEQARAGDDATVIDLPAFVGKRDARS